MHRILIGKPKNENEAGNGPFKQQPVQKHNK